MPPETLVVDGAVVAPCGKDVLAVGVPVYVKLDALGVAEVVDEGYYTLILGGVGGGFAAVGLGAGVWRCAVRVCVPLEGPLAVDVAADARLVCWRWRGRLTVLAPESIGGLGVDEACGALDGWAGT